jgi:hypothetical protein
MPDTDKAAEQGAMAGLEKIQKVSEAFSALVGAASSVEELVKLFGGAESPDSAIVEALGALTSVVEHGFKELAEQVNIQTDLEDWRPISNKIHDWQAIISGRSNQLRGANAKTGRIVADHDVAIKDWCEHGMPGEAKGALDDLIGVLKDMSTELTAGGDDSPLSTWNRLAKDGTFAQRFEIKGESVYTMLLGWQRSLFAMVQSATLVYNSILALYRATPHPKAEYVDPDFVLRELGSSSGTDTEGTAPLWPALHKMLDAYRNELTVTDRDQNLCSLPSFYDTAPPPQAQFGYHGPDDYQYEWVPGPMGEKIRVKKGGTRGQPVFLLGETKSTGNSYYTGLNFEDTTIGAYRYWFLQGTLAKINADGTRKITRYQSDLNGLVAKGDMPTRGPSIHRLEEGDFQYCGDYVDEPAEPSDGSLVVTGFKIDLVGDVLVIALQYGVLIIDANGVQTVERRDAAFHRPNPGSLWWWDKGEIAWVDKQVAGTRSNVPLTNATFNSVNDGTGHYHLTIRARTTWTGYKADVFQPTGLIKFTPEQKPAATPAALAQMAAAT